MSMNSNVELLSDRSKHEWKKIFYSIRTNDQTILHYTFNKKCTSIVTINNYNSTNLSTANRRVLPLNTPSTPTYSYYILKLIDEKGNEREQIRSKLYSELSKIKVVIVSINEYAN
jgi:hypothetical protein